MLQSVMSCVSWDSVMISTNVGLVDLVQWKKWTSNTKMNDWCVLTDIKYPLNMKSGMITIYSHGLNKGFGSEFWEGYWVRRQTSEEGCERGCDVAKVFWV